jgi:hypothetical protein
LTSARSVAGAEQRGVAPIVRFSLCVMLVAFGGGCVHNPPRLDVSSLGTKARLTGRFSGVVRVGSDEVTLLLDSVRISASRWDGESGADDGARGARAERQPTSDRTANDGSVGWELTELSVRAVLASDSSGSTIPLGVSSAVEVSGTMRAGDERVLRDVEFALPKPIDMRLTEVWVVFQLRAIARGAGSTTQEVLSYACSRTNLLGRSKSATQRAQRLRASYTEACRL